MVVAKYGGTSMAHPDIVANIIKKRPEQQIIVCSAPGRLAKTERKVTDLLIDLAQAKNKNLAKKSLNSVINRFEKVVLDFPSKFKEEFISKLRKDLEDSKDYNYVVSRGEFYSAWALAEMIGYDFVDAKNLFCFKKNKKFDREQTMAKIRREKESLKRVVIPGFYGSDGRGKICLFDRGGSDRTGAVLAASLDLDYQNWTDVDGILDGDPSVIKRVRLIPELTYEEVREGAHGGTGVLMGDSILDLEYGKCEVILKNTFNQNSAGTRIKTSRDFDFNKPVTAISARDDLVALTINDLGMRDTRGYLAKILNILAKNNISIEHMPAAQDSITITFHNKGRINLDELKERFNEISVSPSAGCSIGKCGTVYLVGEALRQPVAQHKVMISSLAQLEKNKIVVLATVMHPGSPSIAIIIEREQIDKAQKILHQKLLA